MNVVKLNQNAWDKKVEDGAIYTRPTPEDVIEKAKRGDWNISVTTYKSVPKRWFPDSLKGLNILCLASGGGQQAPILAAAGANVTVTDISTSQLKQDESVAKRDGLTIETIQADMSDLSVLEDESFDYIVHPVSNLFVENIQPVWNEAP